MNAMFKDSLFLFLILCDNSFTIKFNSKKMKRKLFSFIRPSLTLLDNGKFFRKPFEWFYAVIAILSLLAPIIMVFTTIWWNNAFQNKMESQKLYQVVLLPEYQKLQYSYDTLTHVCTKYGKEMNNAIDCLTKATKQADYYGEYASYGPEYQQIYSNALDVKRQWDAAYKDATDRWDAANSELEALKPSYDKVKLNYQNAEAKYKAATDEFLLVDQLGTVFKGNEIKSGNTIVALVLFSFMILLVGAMNFLLWWSRLLKLKTLVKVQDKFVATSVASHFIQTSGESLGLTISLWGFFTALIYFTCHLSTGQFGMNFTNLGVISIFLPIVVGFLVVFIFRIVAELLKAVIAIANHSGE